MLRLSVVIPVYNGALTVADCLRGVLSQTLPAEEYAVIVVDDGSTDSTASVVKDFRVQLVTQPHRGAAAARNRGLSEARGEWVAFTDADCIPSRGWLRALLQAVDEQDAIPPVLGAAGRVIGYQSTASAARFVDLAGGLDAERHLAHPTFPFAPSGNVMYRREAMRTAGGFDARYAAYEACELHTRLLRLHGGAFHFPFAPAAVVLHRHRASWPEYWRQQVGYGRGYAQFLLHHRDQLPWSPWRELRAWGHVALQGFAACWPARGDRSLIRRGTFIKGVAQRTGFVTTYWTRRERARW